MKIRWLVMLLGANAGGGTTLVSMSGHVDPKALRFYRKAVGGKLKKVTPHTEQFKATVTSSGINSFEGVVEGELLSPCELGHDDSIVLVGNNMGSIDLVGPADIAKDGRTECESRLGPKSSKEKNAWIGVLLGIAVNAKKFLCSSETTECEQGGRSLSINFQDGSSGERTYNNFFSKLSDLKKLKLSPEFFKAIGYKAIGQRSGTGFKGIRSTRRSEVSDIKRKYRTDGGRIKEDICDYEEWKNEGARVIQRRKGGEGIRCKEGVRRFENAKYVYVIDARPTEEEAALFGDKGGVQNESRRVDKENHKESRTITFWWWHGADPDYDGSSCLAGVSDNESECERTRDETNLAVKKYGEESLRRGGKKCVPLVELLKDNGTGKKLELTIEAIRCE